MEFVIGTIIGIVIGIVIGLIIGKTFEPISIGTLYIDDRELYLASDETPENLAKREYVIFKISHK